VSANADAAYSSFVIAAERRSRQNRQAESSSPLTRSPQRPACRRGRGILSHGAPTVRLSRGRPLADSARDAGCARPAHVSLIVHIGQPSCAATSRRPISPTVWSTASRPIACLCTRLLPGRAAQARWPEPAGSGAWLEMEHASCAGALRFDEPSARRVDGNPRPPFIRALLACSPRGRRHRLEHRAMRARVLPGRVPRLVVPFVCSIHAGRVRGEPNDHVPHTRAVRIPLARSIDIDRQPCAKRRAQA